MCTSWLDHIHQHYSGVHCGLLFAEAHVREDSRQLVDAVEHHDSARAGCSAQLIRRRCQRLTQAITDDLGVEPSHYTQQQAGKLTAQLKDLSQTGLTMSVFELENWFDFGGSLSWEAGLKFPFWTLLMQWNNAQKVPPIFLCNCVVLVHYIVHLFNGWKLLLAPDLL